MSKASCKSIKGESRLQYRLCVPPCPRYITSGDTHSLCVVCLGVKHTESALEGAGCPHCERLPLCTLRSSLWGGSFRQRSSRCWPRLRWGRAADAFVGLAVGFGRGNGDGRVPIFILTCQIHCPFSGFGSPFCGFFPSEGRLSASPIFLRGGRCGERWLFAHSIPPIWGISSRPAESHPFNHNTRSY